MNWNMNLILDSSKEPPIKKKLKSNLFGIVFHFNKLYLL